MLDTCPQIHDNRIVDRNSSFIREPLPAAFLLPEKTMQLEQTQDAMMQLEYDLLLERSERDENADYPPHTDHALQIRDDRGLRVSGCYMTQAAISTD